MVPVWVPKVEWSILKARSLSGRTDQLGLIVKGAVIGRSLQIMKGYYKDLEATAMAIDEYGWFDTGDLSRINPITGDLMLTGRAKDTIVLSNGETIEPQPLEDAILSGCGGQFE
jgi:long-subunit acyl-CoA synthetase (AMP-forming)